MAFVLLRPKLLTLKNKLSLSFGNPRENPASIAVLSVAIVAAIIVYLVILKTLSYLQIGADGEIVLSKQFLSLTISAIFHLLLFSNFIVAIGSFFRSQDNELLFAAPLSNLTKFFARICQIMISSSWMALLFGIPLIIAYQQTFNLGWLFYLNAALAALPMLFLPAFLSATIIISILSIIPLAKFKNILILSGIALSGSIIFRTNELKSLPTHYDSLSKADFDKTFLLHNSSPTWLPGSWFSELFVKSLSSQIVLVELMPIYLITFTAFLIGALSYYTIYPKAWADSLNNSKPKTKRINSYKQVGSISFIFPSQFRAVYSKEIKTFFRDPTQSVQLLLLLVLTFLYLYNFRSLQAAESLSETGTNWWQALLAVMNIALGSCVISAIATRLVFPTVSLEGKCFEMLRSTPLTIKQLLYYKFYSWFLPIFVVSLVLLVSGAWALFLPFEAILVTAFIALTLSISIVGLAVGIGSVYAEFDWDSPSQLAASFGSLVFMFFTTVSICVSLIPSGVLLALTTIPSLKEQIPEGSFALVIGCSATICLLINISISIRSLKAGEKCLLQKVFL